MNFQRAYTEHAEISAKIRALRIESDAAFQAELTLEFKKLYPRRRKIDFARIPCDIYAPIKARHLAEHMVKENALNARKAELAAWMFDHAPEVEIKPLDEMRQVDKQESYNFSSQPGHNRYARAWLEPYKVLLNSRGIPCEVRVIDERVYRDSYSYTDVWIDYGLFAPLEDWQYCALKLNMTDDVMEDTFKRMGVNSKVYYGG